MLRHAGLPGRDPGRSGAARAHREELRRRGVPQRCASRSTRSCSRCARTSARTTSSPATSARATASCCSCRARAAATRRSARRRCASWSARVEEYLNPRVGRLTLPYLKERPVLGVRLRRRAVEPAREPRAPDPAARRRRRGLRADARADPRARPARAAARDHPEPRDLDRVPADRRARERQRAWPGRACRAGRAASDVELPMVLFGQAGRYGADRGARARLPAPGVRRLARASARRERLFINTVPATVRDTSFLGRGVLDYLGPDLAPSAVTLEITERQVIENLNLYREAMHSFTRPRLLFRHRRRGRRLLGAGDRRHPRAGLPEDRHGPGARRAPEEGQPAGGEGDPGHGRGRRRDRDRGRHPDAGRGRSALRELGVPWGQGYFYARPVDPYAAQPAAAREG